MLAMGLGRSTSVDLALTKHGIGKLKAKYIAWAGVVYAMQQIQNDSKDDTTSQIDTLSQCGIKLDEDKAAEDIFRGVNLRDGYFDVGYLANGFSKGEGSIFYGLQDEERKININAITEKNYKILSHLISLLDFDENSAETIASSVVDWRDQDSKVTNSPYGGEDSTYMGLSKGYHCKNAPFDSVEELLLVKGVTTEIFSNIKKFITVFPKESLTFLVNIHTAPEEVLSAFARSFTGGPTNTDITDADSLVAKIISWRNGEDGLAATNDDRQVEFLDLALNAKEKVIFLAMTPNTTKVSNYLHIKVKGVEQTSSIESCVETIVSREDMSIVYWHRE